jgi:DNA replication protein DnaC
MDNLDEELVQFKRDLLEVDLVIWDDIGTETPTPWVRLQLYIYISHREAEMMSQIFTSNVPLEVMEREQYLGERIVSRITGQCEIFEFKGRGRRGVGR